MDGQSPVDEPLSDVEYLQLAGTLAKGTKRPLRFPVTPDALNQLNISSNAEFVKLFSWVVGQLDRASTSPNTEFQVAQDDDHEDWTVLAVTLKPFTQLSSATDEHIKALWWVEGHKSVNKSVKDKSGLACLSMRRKTISKSIDRSIPPLLTSGSTT